MTSVIYKHHESDQGEVYLNRWFDKKVFGEYRAVHSFTTKKYEIRDGEVKVKFRRQWHTVEECSPNAVDYQIRYNKQRFEEGERDYCWGVRGSVKFA